MLDGKARFLLDFLLDDGSRRYSAWSWWGIFCLDLRLDLPLDEGDQLGPQQAPVMEIQGLSDADRRRVESLTCWGWKGDIRVLKNLVL